MGSFPVFKAFVGVDQTGATYPGALRAKPLPAALLCRAPGGVWRLSVALLPAAGRDELRGFVESEGARFGGELAIVLDCVLGLPRACWPYRQGRAADGLWRMMKEAARHPKFGRVAIARFDRRPTLFF